MKLNKYLLKSLLLRPMMPLQTTTCNALVAEEVKCNIRKPRALKSLLGISTESLRNKKKILEKNVHKFWNLLTSLTLTLHMIR